MYLTPSLTPRNPPHPPSLRLYRYSRTNGAPLDFADYTLDLAKANARGEAEWREAPSALHTHPLNLSALTPSEWARGLRSMLRADHRPASAAELDAADPFLHWVSAERCTREAYVGSGRPGVPPLRKCKLAHLCASLHIDDEGYAECIGQPLAAGRRG